MSQPPFGFGPADRPDEPGRGDDPFGLSALFGGAAGGGDMFGMLQSLMSWRGGPVNWDLARKVADAAVLTDDRPVTAEQRKQVIEACRLADVWLDPITTLPGTAGEPRAWSRTGWLESTLPAWQQLVDPVAAQVVKAMGGAMQQGLAGGAMGGLLGDSAAPGNPPGGGSLPPELAGLLGGAGLGGMMNQIGGMVFGAQVGQALGALAGEVLGATDIGLPLGDVGRAALIPSNVAAFGTDLEVPADEVLLYLALRELAHQRLFAHVPWLRSHLYDAVEAYGRGIEVDAEAISRAVGSFDPSDPESLQRALGDGMFDLKPTPTQQAALDRLETALALVEGWVDAIVDQAAAGPLPHAAQLRETVRRRRASGGPAEQTFAALVGLQLRPRRLREAAALWSAVAAARGPQGRDALWNHPDLLPGPRDLDDPQAFVAGSDTDWDAGLRDMDLSTGNGPDVQPGTGPDKPQGKGTGGFGAGGQPLDKPPGSPPDTAPDDPA